MTSAMSLAVGSRRPLWPKVVRAQEPIPTIQTRTERDELSSRVLTKGRAAAFRGTALPHPL